MPNQQNTYYKYVSKYAIVIIILAALIIRLAGTNTILFFEEAEWAMFSEDHTFTNLGLTFVLKAGPPVLWPHPPLAPILFKLATLQGATTAALRMVPLVFGMATIILMYFMTKRFYSKKTALITSGLMAIGYWHLLASLVVDIDGGILTFFLMLISYMLLLYDDTGKNRYLLICGIAFGISLLSKYSVFLMLPVIFAYFVLRKNDASLKQKVLTALKVVITISLIGLVVFSVFPIASVIIGKPEVFMYSVEHSGGYTRFEPTLRPLMVMFAFGTPLFILLSIAALRNWRHNKNLFFLLFVFYFIFMYSFLLGSIGTESTYEKYLMIIIPSMSLLAGDFISRIHFSKKYIKLFVFLTVISTAAIILMNLPAAEYIDHSVPEYQRRAISAFSSGSLSEWNFNLPLMGNVQPGFWINFYSLAITSIVSFLLFVLYFVKRSRMIFIIFLAVVISVNIFYIQEFLIHTTHPDINKVTYEMAEYFNTRYSDRPLYSTTLQLAFYTHRNDDFFVGADDDSKDQALQARQAGAVMLVTEYYPNIHKNSQAWKNINMCRLEKEFSDKGVIVGRVFVC
ncbi:MAG TPA: glycosyltransferase family 39 protein [archaeon]|nr:glycosyltransferase family 39 protein [archaeon]